MTSYMNHFNQKYYFFETFVSLLLVLDISVSGAMAFSAYFSSLILSSSYINSNVIFLFLE
jgi:hypothetical protein